MTAFQDCSILNSVTNWYSYRFLFASEQDMTAHSTVDPESFQRLLSNAFAVQESGMDAESLTAIVELQRAVATGEADAFQHREVLTYRLMAALVGEAMSYAARPEQKKAQAADLSTMPQSIRLARPQREAALNDRASVPAAATNRAIYQAFGTFIARAGRLPALTHSAWAVLKRAKCVPWYKGRWETAVGVAAVLVIACWICFRDRRPASPLGVSGLQGSNAARQQMPFAPAKRVLANSTSKPQTALGLEPGERKTSRSMPQRVLDRNIRVRYI